MSEQPKNLFHSPSTPVSWATVQSPGSGQQGIFGQGSVPKPNVFSAGGSIGNSNPFAAVGAPITVTGRMPAQGEVNKEPKKQALWSSPTGNVFAGQAPKQNIFGAPQQPNTGFLGSSQSSQPAQTNIFGSQSSNNGGLFKSPTDSKLSDVSRAIHDSSKQHAPVGLGGGLFSAGVRQPTIGFQQGTQPTGGFPRSAAQSESIDTEFKKVNGISYKDFQDIMQARADEIISRMKG